MNRNVRYRTEYGDILHLRQAGGPWWYWRLELSTGSRLSGGPIRGQQQAVETASEAAEIPAKDWKVMKKRPQPQCPQGHDLSECLDLYVEANAHKSVDHPCYKCKEGGRIRREFSELTISSDAGVMGGK